MNKMDSEELHYCARVTRYFAALCPIARPSLAQAAPPPCDTRCDTRQHTRVRVVRVADASCARRLGNATPALLWNWNGASESPTPP